jgi:hypothetical protein
MEKVRLTGINGGEASPIRYVVAEKLGWKKFD